MKNKKPIVFIVLLVSVFLIIGGTIAYYTSSDTFNNEFNTGTYGVEAKEDFVSPDNWTPGTTTPKTVIATNKGSTPIAVRIKLTPSWEDANGDPLPLTDGNDNEAAIINFSNNYNKKWVYQDGYYYYKRALNENQSTTSLLKSVTFNPDFDINNINNCETVNGVTTCTTEYTDYSGGKYTLQVEIETAQYDKYEEIWGTTVEIEDSILINGMLMKHNNYPSTKTFDREVNRSSFESITTIDEINIPDNAIDSWDCSQEKNESVMCWYVDSDSNSKYELYIGQEDGVIANPDSSYAFSNFTNARTIDLTFYNTTGVTNMNGMFYYAGSNATTFRIENLSNFNTSSVTSMSSMFANTGSNATTYSIGEIGDWDTSNVTSMESMFYYAGSGAQTFELDLSNWETPNVTNMRAMFYYTGYNSTSWNIGDLSDWNTSNVTDMNDMFHGAGYTATTFELDLSNWNTTKVTNMYSMFYDSGYNATTWNIGDLSEWKTSNVNDMSHMFECAGYNATTFNIGNLSEWDTSNVEYLNSMFDRAGYSATTWNSIGTLKIYDASIQYMFYNCLGAKATLNIYGNPIYYNIAFNDAAIAQGSGITVNYSSTTTNIDDIIATKASDSNVVKGSVISN